MNSEEIFARLNALRRQALIGRDPTAADETLAILIQKAKKIGARRILEIGSAECLTSIALHLATGADIIAIELDAARAEQAQANIHAFGVERGVRLIEGDAGEILPCLEDEFDLIFLDGPKAQYRRYFPECKRLLKKGGVLASDDILLFGWVQGEPPLKRRMLVEHIREYLNMLEADPDFDTEILEVAEGLAISQRK